MKTARHEEPATIAASAGTLAAVLHLPETLPAPVVICCHGLLSSKESPKYRLMCEALAVVGVAAVRFDFAGCGESPGVPAGSLVSGRLSDLFAVLGRVRGAAWHDGRVGLFGASLGGYVALLAAAQEGPGVAGVVTWAAPFDLLAVQRAAEAAGGETGLPPGVPVGEPGTLGGLPPVPGVLVVHGERDRLVSWRHAVEIQRRLGEPGRLLLCEGADHTFSDGAWLAFALRASVSWFRERLPRP